MASAGPIGPVKGPVDGAVIGVLLNLNTTPLEVVVVPVPRLVPVPKPG